jgi:chaperonin GroES
MAKFRPIWDAVLVKRAEVRQTKSGIVIPLTAGKDDTFFEGTVVSAGDGLLTDSGNVVSLKVKAGDQIMFGKNGFVEVKIDGENFLIMRENNILGVIESDA